VPVVVIYFAYGALGLIDVTRDIEHRAASGKRRKTPAGCSGEGQAVLCVQTAKKRPFSLTQNQPPKTGKVAA
jgi:hypothetical protein